MIPLSVAAGWVKRPADIHDLLILDPSVLGSITLGSYTVEPREGNSGTTFSSPLNALGLPNPGIEAACEYLPDIGKQLHDHGMRMRVSIAGFSPEEYAKMARMLSDIKHLDAIEINFACPNVRIEGKRKPIMAFDPYTISETIGLLYDIRNPIKPAIDAKLSPYSDPLMLEKIANTISSSRSHRFGIRNIVVANTFPDAYGFDEDGNPLLTANEGYGGLSGPAMRHIILGNARQFRKNLPEYIGVVACGGIDSGIALRDAELVGAIEAQVGIAYFESNDPGIFQSIMEQRVALDE